MQPCHSTNTTLMLALILLTAICSAAADSNKQNTDIRTHPVTVAPLNLGPNEKQVSLVMIDKGVPVVNTEITLSYYDEVSLSAVSKKATTDDKGIVSFIVPGRDDGASYVFRFGLGRADLSHAMAIRIAPQNVHGGQKVLVLVFTKRMEVTNREGCMQLVRFPNEGRAVPPGGDVLFKGSTITYR